MYCEVITLMNLVDIHSEIRVFFPVVRILKICSAPFRHTIQSVNSQDYHVVYSNYSYN